MPPARKIPGMTAADTHPGACVDCHIIYKEMNLDTVAAPGSTLPTERE